MLAGLAMTTPPAAAQAAIQGAATPVPEEMFTTLDRTETVAPSAAFDRMRTTARAKGDAIRVIVGLRVRFTPEGVLTRSAGDLQHRAIADATSAVRRALGGTAHRVVHTYDSVPFIALELSQEALTRLQNSGLAATISEDRLSPPSLAQSSVIVEARESSAVGRDGRGTVVAILDTGVQKTHPFLQQAAGGSKVVSEACFSGNGNCPGGLTSSIAVGSGVNCTYAVSGCRHGTHVAGIAAGRGGPGTGATFSGVASGANLIAIQVFSRFTGAQCANAGEDPCALSFQSDQLAGLQRVFALRNTFTIGAANMSLGGGSFTGDCDGSPLKPAIDNLRSARIATVIASGNDGFSNAVGEPGCISTAITVGATDKSDVVALFSNSSSVVDLFAPGVDIRSSVPNNAFAFFDGTSMATPHVAGAWAIARQVSPNATVTQVEASFDDTGKPITDTLANPQITRDRIRVFSAAANLRHTGLRLRTAMGPLAGLGIASRGIGLARRTNPQPNPTTPPLSGVINLTTIPPGGRVRQAFVVYQVLGAPDPNFTFAGAARTAQLVGGSGQFTCWGTNNGGAYRTYRFNAKPFVSGNGSFPIGGIGGANSAIAGRSDGQGASLVVIYDVPGSPDVGRAVINWGSMTVRPGGPAMTHTFTGLVVPAGVFTRSLHLGVGDGETFADPAMRLNGSAITPASFWNGSDGEYWDNDRRNISAAQLPIGTVTRTISQGATGECLTMSYAGLTYQN
jgi:subtilisin family serine protease